MKICFETYGCRLNRAEALQQEADLVAKGHIVTRSHAKADLIVLRGCSVTARAQRDCERMIAHLKRRYPATRLIVEGCLPETDKVGNLSRILDAPDGNTAPPEHGEKPIPTSTARAYLKVQDGCNSKCSFCIVPTFRGKARSVPFDEVLACADRFVESGYREIVLTGCNLMQYADSGRGFPELVAALAERQPSVRFRLGSVEPGPIASRLVSTMATHGNICRSIHLSIQSGSNEILRLMKRPYHARDIEDLVQEARDAMPDIGIGCDIIVGFPGETEMDFHATFGMVKRLKFSKAHVFPFSERPGTAAADMQAGEVPGEKRHLRASLVSEHASSDRAAFARKFVGKTVEIVTESEESDEKASGWTSQYLWCRAVGHSPRKSLAKVFVTACDGDQLRGRLIEERTDAF